MRLLVPLFHDDSYASMLRNYRLFRLIVFRNFTAVCERVCEQMRVNDANTRVCCNYPQLKFATTLFVPTRSGNRGNEYLYSFFLSSFLFLFLVDVDRVDGWKAFDEEKKKIKFFDLEIAGGKKEETKAFR